MRILTKLEIIACVFSITSCEPTAEVTEQIVMTDTAEVDSTVTVALQETQPATDTEIPAPTTTAGSAMLMITDAICEELGAHTYCLSAEWPAPPDTPPDWGAIFDYSPEIFCAAELATELCGWVTSALLTAAMEWGNYGPMEYWILGIDKDAGAQLINTFCQRRDDRKQWPMSQCVEHQSAPDGHGFEAYRKIGADAVASGQPSGSAGLNGDREWGIHFFTSSIPLGFTDYFEVPGAEEQKTVFHEYFHAVQHSYIFTKDHKKRDELLGPIWFNEGGAEYMAQIASRKARTSGALEDINSSGRWSFEFRQNMENFMYSGTYNISNTCPGTSLKDLSYENNCNNAAYDLGAWAHAYLAYNFGESVLMEVFLPKVEQLGWEEAFIDSYGKTSDEFYSEFDQFLKLPRSEQMAILP